MHQVQNKIIENDIDQIINSPIPWDKFNNKTILITGATGFIASWITKTLLSLNEKQNRNITVIATSRDSQKVMNHYKNYQSPQLQFLQTNLDQQLKITTPVHYIIHAASMASSTDYGADPVGTLMPNIIGTYQLLEYARKKPIEGFLFLSSSEIYGMVPDSQQPITESQYGIINPLDIRSSYGESKRMAETMLLSYWTQYQIPAYIVRIFQAYGPGMRLEDGRVQTDFISNILSGKHIQIKSTGEAKRTFCYITDVLNGLWTVLLRGQPGNAYNVGNEHAEIAIRDLAKLLCDLYPEKKLQATYKKHENPNYLQSPFTKVQPDTTKLQLLGWHPTCSIREGFKKTIESYL